jgi:hypothetical protein
MNIDDLISLLDHRDLGSIAIRNHDHGEYGKKPGNPLQAK